MTNEEIIAMEMIQENIRKWGKRMNRKTVKEWEIEKGIVLRENKVNNKITEKQFQKKIKSEYIKCKTEKGLLYISEIK